MKILILILVTPLLLSAQAFRGYSNEFLTIGVDAAGLGMSKSVVASSNDVNSIYWNPAGLVGIKDYQGSLMHASYFAGIANYNHASFALPLNKESAIGISIIRFGVDDQAHGASNCCRCHSGDSGLQPVHAVVAT